MKTNGKHEVMARIVRQSLVLAALLAMALSAPSINQAQSSAASPAAPAAKPAVASAKAPAGPAAKPPAKGSHEGITVHGHWIIEVKNPDGTVVTHREFENSLAGGPGGPVGSNTLAGLLSGLLTPGPWTIFLYGGACSTGVGGPGSQACVIISPNATSTVSSYGCSTSLASASPQPFCYATLTESLQGTGSFFTTFALSGSAYADTSATINSVGTVQVVCSNFANPPIAPGTAISPSTTSPGTCLAAPGNIAGAQFTSAVQSVPVTAGQTIAVSVTISFGSPS
jgi:hypothetical protein